jgi:hypothetical protein
MLYTRISSKRMARSINRIIFAPSFEEAGRRF